MYERRPPAPPRVLALCDYYLPGFRAGGPPRSLAATARRLAGDIELRVLTRDRDLGGAPYPGIAPGGWYLQGAAKVRYLAPREIGPRGLAAAVREAAPDLLYLNSVFSRGFTLLPLLLRAAGRLPRVPVLLAPRGELGAGALALRRRRKRAFLTAARASGLFRGVLWHAASELEAEEVRRHFGGTAATRVAEDLCDPIFSSPPAPPPKRPGELRVAFLSRISPTKNLDGALRLLAGVPGRVLFTVYGPEEDAAYAAECRALAASLPHPTRVRFAGPVRPEDVGPALASHHLFLLPTRGESFGHVVGEALQAGCPVLLSDRTPWGGLEADGAGWALPLDDPERFRDVLRRMVAMDDGEHARLAAAALLRGRRAAEDPAPVARTRALFAWAAAGG